MRYPNINSAPDIVEWLWSDMEISDEAISHLTASSRSAIWHIRHGQQSGRNLLPRLQNLILAIYANESGNTVRVAPAHN
jgi:hypothetical protein